MPPLAAGGFQHLADLAEIDLRGGELLLRDSAAICACCKLTEPARPPVHDLREWRRCCDAVRGQFLPLGCKICDAFLHLIALAMRCGLLACRRARSLPRRRGLVLRLDQAIAGRSLICRPAPAAAAASGRIRTAVN